MVTVTVVRQQQLHKQHWGNSFLFLKMPSVIIRSNKAAQLVFEVTAYLVFKYNNADFL